MFLFLSANILYICRSECLMKLVRSAEIYVWIVSLAAIDAQSKRLPGWRGSDLLRQGRDWPVSERICWFWHISRGFPLCRCLSGVFKAVFIPVPLLCLPSPCPPACLCPSTPGTESFLWFSAGAPLSCSQPLRFSCPVFGWVGLMLRFPCFLTLGGVKTKANIPLPPSQSKNL